MSNEPSHQKTSRRPVCVYVDVDDTLVRSASSKHIPIPSVIGAVRALKDKGAVLYCWSSGGEEYARRVAEECGIADCFRAFLPKPDVLVDDQHVSEWRRMLCVLPSNLSAETLDNYWADVWGLPSG
jgi:predicted HAD superfamily phosphohydrolase YqeG